MLTLARTALPRARFPFSARYGVRYVSSTPSRPTGRRTFALASGGIALGLATVLSTKVYADSAVAVALPGRSKAEVEDEATRSSFGTLVRTYVVYTMCSIPALVDSAPWLLETLTSIPGLRWITERIVRVTFFDQFVGGDSAAETLPVMRSLRSTNVGTLFAYSVEVDEAEAMAASAFGSTEKKSPHRAIVDEMIHCIEVAADFEDGLGAKQTGRRTWVAVKMTALLPDAGALIRLSSHIVATRPPTSSPHVVFPGAPSPSDLDALYAKTSALSDSDVAMLRELHASLEAICTRAAARSVRIIFDAEYTWYQPAIDALTLALMRRFNALSKKNSENAVTQPLIYVTFQAYLRRTPAHLAHAIRDAEKHRYALGAKLVRGAYHTHESAAHGVPSSLSISPEAQAPVWDLKAETDAAYDACAGMLLDAVANTSRGGAQVGVLFGTHNWASCRRIFEGLKERGLASLTGDKRLRITERVGERVTFGQLYGMCDDLTRHLAAQAEAGAPMVIKYVPYGALSEVMPYLSRRAIENKSVLGGGAAQAERARAGRLLWGRVFG